MRMKIVQNDRGIALVLVLTISLISLAIVASMLYMVTVGTRMSGYLKQFKSAEEASFGVTEMIRDFMLRKGDMTLPMFNPNGTDWLIGGNCSCDTNNDGNVTVNDNLDNSLIPPARSCRCDKICSSSAVAANWALCTPDDRSLDPTVNYDFRDQATGLPIVFGTGLNQFDVFVKIVDTVEGNSDMGGIVTGGGSLAGGGVVASSAGIVTPPHAPYLYRMEVQAQRNADPLERSRLSALYAY